MVMCNLFLNNSQAQYPSSEYQKMPFPWIHRFLTEYDIPQQLEAKTLIFYLLSYIRLYEELWSLFVQNSNLGTEQFWNMFNEYRTFKILLFWLSIFNIWNTENHAIS